MDFIVPITILYRRQQYFHRKCCVGIINIWLTMIYSKRASSAFSLNSLPQRGKAGMGVQKAQIVSIRSIAKPYRTDCFNGPILFFSKFGYLGFTSWILNWGGCRPADTPYHTNIINDNWWCFFVCSMNMATIKLNNICYLWTFFMHFLLFGPPYCATASWFQTMHSPHACWNSIPLFSIITANLSRVASKWCCLTRVHASVSLLDAFPRLSALSPFLDVPRFLNAGKNQFLRWMTIPFTTGGIYLTKRSNPLIDGFHSTHQGKQLPVFSFRKPWIGEIAKPLLIPISMETFHDTT